MLLDTAIWVGGVMLLASLVFAWLAQRAFRGTGGYKNESSATTYVLMAFAFFAMGLLVFLFGLFRPGGPFIGVGVS